jgi:hypothetical protein
MIKMKHIFFAVILAVAMLSFQKDSGFLNNAFKAADAKTIASYFQPKVEINIPGSEGLYSKNQAELMIKKFFENNPPQKYELLHNGSSNAGDNYVIGKYTSTNTIFRTFVLYQVENGKPVITEFRIEPFKE